MQTPQRIPFTRDGFNKVIARLAELTAKRPHILVRLQTAREMGDLSENGAYKAARFELSDCDRELRHLTYLSRIGKVIDMKPTNQASFGSKVTLKNPSRTFQFTLVNEYEADPATGKLSVKSPYGQAVTGKRIGDQVVVKTPNGIESYTIEALL